MLLVILYNSLEQLADEIMTITWYKRCLCITELTGIGVELPSSELELNCLRDFVPESELNWN